MADQVAFPGIIKSIRTSIDAIGDKVGQITIAFRPEGDTIAELDKIHVPDREIFVVIVERSDSKYAQIHNNGKTQVRKGKPRQTQGGEV